MFKSIKSVALLAALATTALAASASAQTATPSAASSGFSWNQGYFEKVVSLNDGSALHEYSDGKMALEDKFGRAVYLKEGQSLETADGQKITANGNEVARLDGLLRQGHSNR